MSLFFCARAFDCVCCAINLPASADENKAVRLIVALLHDGPVLINADCPFLNHH